jgi:hypothetical protein
MGRQRVLNWMVANITWIQFAVSFLMNQILSCYCHSHIFSNDLLTIFMLWFYPASRAASLLVAVGERPCSCYLPVSHDQCLCAVWQIYFVAAYFSLKCLKPWFRVGFMVHKMVLKQVFSKLPFSSTDHHSTTVSNSCNPPPPPRLYAVTPSQVLHYHILGL